MITANEQLFDRLWRAVPSDLAHNATHPAKRYLATDSEEKALIKGARVVAELELTPGVRAAIVSHRKDRRVAVLPGPAPDPATVVLDHATVVDCNAGWLTILGGESWFRLADVPKLGERLLDEVFGRVGGYTVDELVGFYAPFHLIDVTRCTSETPCDADIARVAAASLLVSETSSFRPERQVAVMLLQVLADDHDGRFAHAIFRALTAVHWVHSYLEVYRCIESFYAEPYLAAVSKRLGIHGTDDLHKALADELDWKPREDVALERVLKRLDTTRVEELYSLFQTSFPGHTGREKSVVALARHVYRLRNQIAHHRVDLAGTPGVEWRSLIEGLWSTVRHLQVAFTRT